ncbi:hypothetical protein P3W85_11750 [Cupriavidus basilensis]|uniref:Uncharacterized protein n=1 Tax=Cupriavidus basilensis TaxID=68895 RepID=A0ABT6ALW7_9BURK|nr:hypothetical protein [Cupriavidus basilensis]MDF3833617.1 hypothetical protein [Cupriavidus basilensis]
MPLSDPPFRPCGHVLHTRPALFVLVNYAPMEGQPSWRNASCEFMEEGNADAGAALSVHISPFDALLNAAFISEPGKPYHIANAASFDPRTLICDSGGKLHINLHCGWAASHGRIIVRRKGSLASVCMVQTEEIPEARLNAIDVAIDQDGIARYERLREHAGLFAHADSHCLQQTWTEQHRHRAVALAIRRMPGTVSVGAEINQVALYDPEAARWHFVPIEVFSGNPDRTANA